MYFGFVADATTFFHRATKRRGGYPSGFVTPLNEPHETARSPILRRLPRRLDIAGLKKKELSPSPAGSHCAPAGEIQAPSLLTRLVYTGA